MRIALTTGLVSFLFLTPLIASAQTNAELLAKIDSLLAQIKTLQQQLTGTAAATPVPAASASCPALTRLLAVGSRGADVSALQDFLRAKGYMSDTATGYFGVLTEAAVKKLQVAEKIVSSGTAATTGYGAVGPKTRTAIASLCAAPATPQAPAQQCAQATSVTPPSISCGGTWEKLQNLGCHIGWRCALPTSGANKPPVITAIDGPTSLERDVFGSWKVNAIDPEGGALAYSVIWGDEGIEDVLKAIAGLGGTFSSASSFTHSFTKTGTFTMQVTAKDGAGATAVGALAIKVGVGTSTTGTTPFTPVTSTSTSAASCITPWGNQVVTSGGSVYWQPFFTEGAYYATTSPLMKCDSGSWKKCDAAGGSCQEYTHPTSTPSTAALPSYTTSIGGSCSPEGSTRQVQVPPGTQLCQWLSCRTTTQVETITLKCSHSGWTDYANY
jgi:peptidoglycan hydrolase-like protein with peptidoglycan-binding domain